MLIVLCLFAYRFLISLLEWNITKGISLMCMITISFFILYWYIPKYSRFILSSKIPKEQMVIMLSIFALIYAHSVFIPDYFIQNNKVYITEIDKESQKQNKWWWKDVKIPSRKIKYTQYFLHTTLNTIGITVILEYDFIKSGISSKHIDNLHDHVISILGSKGAIQAKNDFIEDISTGFILKKNSRKSLDEYEHNQYQNDIQNSLQKKMKGTNIKITKVKFVPFVKY
jgi:hypothetical protein